MASKERTTVEQKIKEQLSVEEAKQILFDMIRIRELEEASAQQYSEGKIRGFLHLYIGEEPIAATILPLLKPQDQFFGTYREHAHALMKGITARSIMAEMFGKVEGCSKGRGGSMHIFDLSKSFYGGNAIVAGHLPLAIGMALANKMQKNDLISICFFGEGAIAEGEFHESMNMAKLWKLPVLFVCENNYYAMGTALERSESQTNLIEKAKSYKVEAKRVNGRNVAEIKEAAKQAIDFVRSEQQPYFLEAQTYRLVAHSMFDSQQYRSKEEVEYWKKHHDPIAEYIHQLKCLGWVNSNEIKEMQDKAKTEMDDAISYAQAGTTEDFQSCMQDVLIGEY